MILTGLMEMFSVLVVFPFLSVILNPEKIDSYRLVLIINEIFSIRDPSLMILLLTFIFIFITLASTVLKISTLAFISRFSAVLGIGFTRKSYLIALKSPYETHLKKNSSELIVAARNYVDSGVDCIRLFLQFCTSSFIAISIIIGIFSIDFIVALIVSSCFIICYLTAVIITKDRLRRLSKIIAENNQLQVKLLQEGTGSIREMILENNYEFYVSKLEKISSILKMSLVKVDLFSSMPRYIIEGLGISLVALVAIILNSSSSTSSTSAYLIPLLGTLALSAQRLLPAMQQAYGSWASMRTNLHSINKLLEITEQPIDLKSNLKIDRSFLFEKSIDIQNISYRYDSNLPFVLNNLNIKIKKGECIGFIGSTGSGKSTFLDILIGLLKPSSGKLLIDGNDLHDIDNKKLLMNWRSIVSHVPQQIYLSDASVLENIAFGEDVNDIDFNRVKKAAELAQIASFIEKTQMGYKSFVGERGVKLSGGQRQRIGLARALYKKSQILVLDEATSALDMLTEKKVMESIAKYKYNYTIFIIAHRYSTVMNCDKLIKMKNGSIEAIGTPEEIISDVI
tara:strand:+ start:7780 stop:9480 length:1701 start_codon:yes stop_codon:yes gene_type:complete